MCLGYKTSLVGEKNNNTETMSELMQCFILKLRVFHLQGSSEAQPVLQEEKGPARAASPTGAVHLPHQLQRHPAGVPARHPAMPAPGCVQSEREPRDGKGKMHGVHRKDLWLVFHLRQCPT